MRMLGGQLWIDIWRAMSGRNRRLALLLQQLRATCAVFGCTTGVLMLTGSDLSISFLQVINTRYSTLGEDDLPSGDEDEIQAEFIRDEDTLLLSPFTLPVSFGCLIRSLQQPPTTFVWIVETLWGRHLLVIPCQGKLQGLMLQLVLLLLPTFKNCILSSMCLSH